MKENNTIDLFVFGKHRENAAKCTLVCSCERDKMTPKLFKKLISYLPQAYRFISFKKTFTASRCDLIITYTAPTYFLYDFEFYDYQYMTEHYPDYIVSDCDENIEPFNF